MAGTAAVAGEVFRPIEGLAAPQAFEAMNSHVYGRQPCAYRLHGLMQDATRNGGMALGNPVFAPQGSQYCVKMCWEPKEIHVAQTDPIGGMTFRGSNNQNYYYLVFFPHAVGFSRIQNGQGMLLKRVHRKINGRHPAMFELEMDGNHFSVKDTARRGHPTIMRWTDHWNVAPHGDHLDHWTKAGVRACWEFVHGKPM
jgi:hypothetical protein